jgi:hypothetical protein
MGRIGWFGVIAVVVTAVIVLALYSMAQAVNVCIARAHAVLDSADPFDRNPPGVVARIVEREVGRERLAEVLSTVLLDRLGCARGNVDWMILKPALAWQLRQSFSEPQLVGLFTSTIDTGAGKLGLAAGALKYYEQPAIELNEGRVECLVLKALGVRRDFEVCGTEGFWVRPRY